MKIDAYKNMSYVGPNGDQREFFYFKHGATPAQYTDADIDLFAENITLEYGQTYLFIGYADHLLDEIKAKGYYKGVFNLGQQKYESM